MNPLTQYAGMIKLIGGLALVLVIWFHGAGWALVPADWIARIPAWVPGAFGWGAILALAAAGLARVVQQRSLRK